MAKYKTPGQILANKWRLKPFFITLLACSGGIGHADERRAFCDDLQSLILHTEQNLEISPFLMESTPGATCGNTTSLTGAGAGYCYWAFPYRNGDSDSFFNRLKRETKDCAGQDIREITQDQLNHPDTFAQTELVLENGILISLSQKDKIVLGETYVFVRVEPAQE